MMMGDLSEMTDVVGEIFLDFEYFVGTGPNGKVYAYRTETPLFCFEANSREEITSTVELALYFHENKNKKTNFEKVTEFHRVFGLPIGKSPAWPDESSKSEELRIKLIEEELQELRHAIEDRDLVEVADALGDLLYVIYGAGVTFGMDMDACVQEVHDSNMTKLYDDGKPRYREDGKILKGPNFRRPDLKKILNV